MANSQQAGIIHAVGIEGLLEATVHRSYRVLDAVDSKVQLVWTTVQQCSSSPCQLHKYQAPQGTDGGSNVYLLAMESASDS